MDSFDYFLVVFVLADIAKDKSFGATATQLAFITTATRAMRPVGALLFGLWADRVGRRIPLIGMVVLYSVAGLLCAVGANFTVLLFLRLASRVRMGPGWR